MAYGAQTPVVAAGPVTVTLLVTQVRPGIGSFAGSQVTFTDGRREDYDMIVYATGFSPNVSFIDDRTVTGSASWPWAHRRLFARGYPNLFLNGYYINNGAFSQVANVHAELIARCVVNSTRARAVVAEDMRKHPSEYHSGHVIKSRSGHLREMQRLIDKIS
jgi:hypothetical protein